MFNQITSGADSTAVWRSFEHLPAAFLDPSNESMRIPFRKAVGGLGFYDFLEQDVLRVDGAQAEQTALDIFTLAVGGHAEHFSRGLIPGQCEQRFHYLLRHSHSPPCYP